MKFKVDDKAWVMNLPLRPMIGTITDVDDVLGYKVEHPANFEFMNDTRYCEHQLYSYPNEVDNLITRLRDLADDFNGFADRLEREIADEEERKTFDEEMHYEARAGIAREDA